MKKISLFLVNIFLLCAVAACDTPEKESVAVYKAWARETANANTPAGVFLTIHNDGENPLILTGFKADNSPRVELHAVSKKDGVFSMDSKTTLTIAPETTFDFAVEEHHFMLWDMTNAIKAGDEFYMTLTFENIGDMRVKVTTTDAAGW